MKPFVIITFYQFTPFEGLDAMKKDLLALMQAESIRGTIILANEGINGTLCGGQEGIGMMTAYLRALPGLQDLVLKESFHDENPFEKAKVKLRREIVTMGIDHVDPSKLTGEHVPPAEWNALLTDPEVMVVDTRNRYEVMLGTFEGAIDPETVNFRDFPEYVRQKLLPHKDKKIAMFCTGGVRCEKSTAYLLQQGFERVYQLDGGILNYLAQVPGEESLWRGTCFVFDERVALDASLQGLENGTIDKEWKNKHRMQHPEAP